LSRENGCYWSVYSARKNKFSSCFFIEFHGRFQQSC
jgi:hypothetical protein